MMYAEVDNCAVFRKIPSKSVMIVTEKRPTGQIVACAMVRGVTPGTIVCSDPSDSLGGALASLHDKTMRTVHGHRNADSGGTLHVSDRRATKFPPKTEDEDDEENADWPSDYDVLSEASDDQHNDDDDDDDDDGYSDTDGEDDPILTPATTTTTTTATITTTTGHNRPVVVPWSRPDCITYAISCPHRFALLPPVRVCGSCVKPPTVLRQTATSLEPSSGRWVPVGMTSTAPHEAAKTPDHAACSAATSLGCSPVNPPAARCQLLPRQSHYPLVRPEGQPRGQSQQQQQLGPPRPAQPRRDEVLQHGRPAPVAAPVSPMQNLNGMSSSSPVTMPRQEAPSDVKISPIAMPPAPRDAVFDVAFVANWRGRSRQGFLAKSRAGTRALQVSVLDYCMQHSSTFKGQLAPAPAMAQQDPGMPAPAAVTVAAETATVVDRSEVRPETAGVSSVVQDEGEAGNTPTSAAQPAPLDMGTPPLPPRCAGIPVPTTASLMRPIPFAPRHGGMVWWSGGWLKVKLLSAGAGDAAAAVKYDLRAYTGDDLTTLFRMCALSGSVPTVEVDVEFARRPARRCTP